MTDENLSADEFLDARGLKCPEPLMMVRQRVRAMRPGATLAIVADDPSTQRDIPQYCRFVQHALLSQEADAGEYRFVLRKGLGDARP